MTTTSARIQSHYGQPVDDAEIEALLASIAAEPTAADRLASIEHLVRVVRLSPPQAVALWRSSVVRDSVALQLVVKRFAREQEYIAERERYGARSEWTKVLEALAAITPF
jgi:hypothetical protein